MAGLQKTCGGIESAPVFCAEAGVEGKEGSVNGKTAELFDFFVELVGLGAVEVGILMPDPEIVIAGMVEMFPICFHIKGNAHIRRTDGADFHAIHFDDVILVHAMAAGEDIIRDTHLLTVGGVECNIASQKVMGVRYGFAIPEDSRIALEIKKSLPRKTTVGFSHTDASFRQAAILSSSFAPK